MIKLNNENLVSIVPPTPQEPNYGIYSNSNETMFYLIKFDYSNAEPKVFIIAKDLKYKEIERQYIKLVA